MAVSTGLWGERIMRRGEYRGYVREREKELGLLREEHNKIKRDYEKKEEFEGFLEG